MVENKLLFTDGASINRPPMFYGLIYQFWKVRMIIFIESVDQGVWDAIVNGPFVPQVFVEGQYIDEPWCDWTDSGRKKA